MSFQRKGPVPPEDPRFRGYKPGDRVVAALSITYRVGLVVEQGTFGTIASLDPHTPVVQVAWDDRTELLTTSLDYIDQAPAEAFVREFAEPLVRVRIAV